MDNPTTRPALQPVTQIVLTHKKILNYFKDNKTVDPEKMFLFFIEFLEKLGIDVSERMTATINTQILSKLSDIVLTQERIYHTQDKIKQGQDHIKEHIGLKLMQIKQEYVDELKAIHDSDAMSILLEKSNHANMEKVSTLLEKTNATLAERVLDKTNLMLNDILPKNNTALSQHIEENIRHFQSAIHTKIDSDTNLKEYIHNLETKFQQMMQNLQTPIQANVALVQQQVMGQEKMQADINEFMNKYRNSSFKGQYGENMLFHLLVQMYPSGEIVKTTGQKASGDILVKREGKPSIMLENKDYSSNVSNDEIHKFIRDIEELKMHGIFLSQRSGIISKHNFQIDIHKGCILVYIHNAEYSQEKIQIAVNMIDTLHTRLDEVKQHSSSSENVIPTEVLNDVYKEYQDFVAQRDALMSMIKESNKKILSTVEEMKFTCLNKYLSSKYATNTVLKHAFACDLCRNFTTTTKQSLSAHKRACKLAMEKLAAAAANGGHT